MKIQEAPPPGTSFQPKPNEAPRLMLSAVETGDEATVTKATDKIEEGLNLLGEYNKALEALAKEKDMTTEH